MKPLYFILFALVLTTTNASGSWEELQSLIQTMIDDMHNMDQVWTYAVTNQTEGIKNMSDRIVYTAKLIDDMGDQIGIMADRIVETEQILSNLTKKCLNCTVEKQKKVQWPDPMGDLIKAASHTLELMVNMSTQFAEGISEETRQIGIMADRIVITECKIMNMSLEIGFMADRIVKTEQMMADSVQTCCNPSAYQSFIKMKPYQYNIAITRDDYCDKKHPDYSKPILRKLWSVQENLKKAQAKVSKIDLSQIDIKNLGFDPLDPWSWFEAAFEKVEDLMFQFFNQAMDIERKGTQEIGHLADEILDMEDRIMYTAKLIGDTADLIVDVENLMLDMMKQACEGKQLDDDFQVKLMKAKRDLKQNLRMIVSHQKLFRVKKTIFLEKYQRQEEAKDQNLGWIIIDIYNDMVAFIDEMSRMGNDMMTIGDQMLQTVTQLGNDIGRVADQIVRMENEIVTMEKRIVATIDIVNDLAKQCYGRRKI